MTDEEKAEVIDTFISIGEKFLKGSKHFHLDPVLTRDTIQAIKELKRENAELEEIRGQQARIINNDTVRIEKLENKLNESNELCNRQAMRITELEEQIEVKKLEILELKAQIEKMKNFYNCAHSSRALCPNEHNCKGCKDWELPE